jgi:hypothetical protein
MRHFFFENNYVYVCLCVSLCVYVCVCVCVWERETEREREGRESKRDNVMHLSRNYSKMSKFYFLSQQLLYKLYGWLNPLYLVNQNTQTTSIYWVIYLIFFSYSKIHVSMRMFNEQLLNNIWHQIMSKAT